MLAKARGTLTMEEFREMFNLPNDAEIYDVSIENGMLEFKMFSAEEFEGKFVKHNEDFGLIRRFRLTRKEDQ